MSECFLRCKSSLPTAAINLTLVQSKCGMWGSRAVQLQWKCRSLADRVEWLEGIRREVAAYEDCDLHVAVALWRFIAEGEVLVIHVTTESLHAKVESGGLTCLSCTHLDWVPCRPLTHHILVWIRTNLPKCMKITWISKLELIKWFSSYVPTSCFMVRPCWSCWSCFSNPSPPTNLFLLLLVIKDGLLDHCNIGFLEFVTSFNHSVTNTCRIKIL